MKKRKFLLLIGILTTPAMTSAVSVADDYRINWYSIGGGESSGNKFALIGSIGQHDAGLMTGGDYELFGGFMAVAAIGCGCPGDINFDGAVNGLDIESFIQCLLSGQRCGCADLDGDASSGLGDLELFTEMLLSDENC